MYLEEDDSIKKAEVIFDNELALLEDIRSRCNADNYVKEPTEKFKPKKDYQHYKLSTGQHVYINQSEDMFVLTKEVPDFSGIQYKGVPMICLKHGGRTSIEYTSRNVEQITTEYGRISSVERFTTAHISKNSTAVQHNWGGKANYEISCNIGEETKNFNRIPDGVKTMLDLITAQPANTFSVTGSILPLSDSDQKRIDKDIGAFSNLLLPACAERVVSEKNDLQDKLDDATKKIQDAEKRIAELEKDNKTLKDGVTILKGKISKFIEMLSATKDKTFGKPVRDIKNSCGEIFEIKLPDNEIKRLSAPENPGK
ncbi:MAG: hypothetical protein ACYC00_20000 [Eubacteriales bacterium]